ncbi:secretin N-terminal domain-containing protein [Pirellulaceae bacterium SH467]
MNTNRSLRNRVLALLLATTAISPAFADGNPELVGVLAVITDPQKAAELGLSDDQLGKLSLLIKQYESKALDLANTLRSAPPAERRTRQMEAIRGIEKQGYEFLSEAQRATAEQWRLRRLGPIAILDPEVAGQLQVTPEQSEKVRNVLEGRSALLRSMGAEKADAEIKNRLVAVLSDEQKGKWSEMTGAPATADVVAPAASPSDSTPSDAPSTSGVPSDSNPLVASSSQLVSGPDDGLLINFNAAPWSEVLKWIAREAELSLQVDAYPTGTFTYRDPYRRYTVAQAMDIMNSVLLSKGYTLVKKQRILMSIDLASAESADVMRSLLREMAELVPPEELDSRGEYEIIKTVFSLERSSIEDIEKEIKLLIGPHGSIVPIQSAGQILVTETGGKLRIIRETIDRSENPDGVRSAKIVRLPLKFVSAEEVLSIARALLDIKDNEYRAEDISISTDTFGNTMFATGSADKLQKLRDIVKELDVKPDESTTKMAASEQPFVRSHLLLGSDPTTTMDVLQSTFAGQPNINMALDPKTNNIIVRATKTDHDFIEKLINELAGQSSEFEIIPLGNIDTNAAVLTLEKFYGKSTSTGKDPAAIKGPIFYGDPAGRRLLVKGTKQEVDQIRMLISKVEESGPKIEGLGDGVRVIPLRGKAADRLLEQLELLRKASRSRIKISLPKDDATKAKPTGDGEIGGKPSESDAPRASLQAVPEGVLVANYDEKQEDEGQDSQSAKQPVVPTSSQETVEDTKSGKGEVTIMQGPSGLIIASDDPEAMSEFDQLLRVAEDQMRNAPAEPTIRFLRHITANAAAELVKSVIAGEQATGGSGGGGLLGDVASSVLGGGGLFGSLFGGGGGSTAAATTVSGAATVGEVVITPDARLNALWIQANPMDALFVEDILTMIDVEQSEVDIQTRGSVQIVYLENTPVEEVEPIVKQVFAAQIAQQQQGGGAGGGQRQPSPEDLINLLRGGGNRRGGGGGGSAQSELKEQTMTISADKKNNALIVVGPPYLYNQVKSLVTKMDEAAAEDEQTILTVPLDGDVNPVLIQNTLNSVFGASARTTSTNASGTTPTTNPTNNGGGRTFDPSQFQRRQQTGGFPFGGGGGFGGGGFGGNGGFNPAQSGRGGQGGNNQGGGNNRGNRGGNNRGTRN